MIIFRKKLDTIEKVNFFLSVLVIILIVVAIVFSIVNKNWWALFVSSGALILALSPTLFEWRYKIDIPDEFEFVILFFIFATIILGEVQAFYYKFWWWDKILHLSSSIALGFIGFAILFILYTNKKLETRPVTIAIFTFTFSLAIGSLWEIFEFLIDSFFGSNMQKSGLVDTMWDLIINTTGAFITAFLGFIYLKGRKTHIIERLASRFIYKNPDLFKK